MRTSGVRREAARHKQYLTAGPESNLLDHSHIAFSLLRPYIQAVTNPGTIPPIRRCFSYQVYNDASAAPAGLLALWRRCSVAGCGHRPEGSVDAAFSDRYAPGRDDSTKGRDSISQVENYCGCSADCCCIFYHQAQTVPSWVICIVSASFFVYSSVCRGYACCHTESPRDVVGFLPEMCAIYKGAPAVVTLFCDTNLLFSCPAVARRTSDIRMGLSSGRDDRYGRRDRGWERGREGDRSVPII